MTYAEARKGIRRAAKYVRSFAGCASASDGETRTPVAILANAGVRSAVTHVHGDVRLLPVVPAHRQERGMSSLRLLCPGSTRCQRTMPSSWKPCLRERARPGVRASPWRAVARVQSGGLGELDAVVLELSERAAGRPTLGAPRESTEPSSER